MEMLLSGRFTLVVGLAALAMFAGMFLLLEFGYRSGRRQRALDGKQGEGLGALEGGVFGVMGLLLAFTFSGAAARFDDRRELVVEEANMIGTAWLRLDLLPAEAQPAIRDSFRSYVDARIATYRAAPDYQASLGFMARSDALQGVIWNQAVNGTRDGWVPAANLLLPALNEMFDITTTRRYATLKHPPLVIFGLLAVLLLISALLAGYGMSGSAKRPWAHAIAFVLLLSLTVWIIMDLEFPRLGFIRVEDFDQAIVEVRDAIR